MYNYTNISHGVFLQSACDKTALLKLTKLQQSFDNPFPGQSEQAGTRNNRTSELTLSATSFFHDSMGGLEQELIQSNPFTKLSNQRIQIVVYVNICIICDDTYASEFPHVSLNGHT